MWIGFKSPKRRWILHLSCKIIGHFFLNEHRSYRAQISHKQTLASAVQRKTLQCFVHQDYWSCCLLHAQYEDKPQSRVAPQINCFSPWDRSRGRALQTAPRTPSKKHSFLLIIVPKQITNMRVLPLSYHPLEWGSKRKQMLKFPFPWETSNRLLFMFYTSARKNNIRITLY